MTRGFASGRMNAMIDAGLRSAGTNLTAVTQAYAQLHTGDPGAAGTANISAGSTTRVAINHSAVAGGSMALSNSPQWTNGGTSETVTDISVWSASTGGTLLYTIQLTASKGWGSGDLLTLNTCSVGVSPLAA